MSQSFLTFTSVSFYYPGSFSNLFQGLSVTFPVGWTGIVGPNGAGKSTLLLLAAGLLPPTEGRVTRPGNGLYCHQRTDAPPPQLTEMFESADPAAGELVSRLGMDPEWIGRWDTLSHGERKRAQVGVALWLDPPLLCIDEPTNHVDAGTRRLLADGLRRFAGIGLLVSHDRELLDGLCTRCLSLGPHGAVMRRGTYSDAAAQEAAERELAHARFDEARDREKSLRRAVTARRLEADRSKVRLSKRHLDRHDSDGRARIDGARLTSKDRTSARLVRETEGRAERAARQAADLSIRKDYELGLWFSSEKARSDTLFTLTDRDIPLGGNRSLHVPALAMMPGDRIALTGPNGAGKSTLLRRIVQDLRLPADRLIFMPQEIGEEESARVAADLAGLGEKEKGRVLTVVNLLGSDPKAVLASARLSPGELRKVMLAIGIARVPHLIILDEPTNHLDLPSIACLTEALSACACGLLLASHDEAFLRDLTVRRWVVEPDAAGDSELTERS